jgi:hypothetical protein
MSVFTRSSDVWHGGTLYALSLSLAWFVYCERVPGSHSGSKLLTTAGGFWKAQWNSIHAHLIAFGGALIGANEHVAIMHRVIGRDMSWFASEHSALLLYGLARLTGSSFIPVLPPSLKC